MTNMRPPQQGQGRASGCAAAGSIPTASSAAGVASPRSSRAPAYYGGYRSGYYAPVYYGPGYRRVIRPAYAYYGPRYYRGYRYRW